MEVGERIRYVRESKNMTQKKLADSIHISPSFMNRIEKGSSQVSLDCVCSIAKVLEVTPQALLCDIFVYPDDNASISERIKITVEKFPPDRQKEFLAVLNTLASHLKLL